MDNKEDILAALEEFEEKSAPDDRVPEILERYLCRIAATGETVYPWDKLKSLFLHKMNLAMKDFYEKVPTDHYLPSPNVENIKFEEMRSRILDMAATFTGAPFTIQRLCELITNPHKHYKRTDKFLRGIEKNILVVSTVDPMGNKIINESKFMLNGMEPNGVGSGELRTPEKIHSPFLPPPPANSPITSLFAAAASSTDAPSPLVHSWSQGGSGDGPAPMTGGNEAMAATIGPNVEQPNWDAFDEYLPPEKKSRLSVTQSSDVNIKSSDVTSQPTPSVADLFSMQGQSLTSTSPSSRPSLNTDCEFGLSSVIDEASCTGSYEPVHTNSSTSQNIISTTSGSVVTSSDAHSVTADTQVTESSSQLAYNPGTAVCSQNVQSSDDNLSDVSSGSFFKHIMAQSETDNSQSANLSGTAETSGGCLPHPQIPSQTEEDGSCSRDSQGFDASPNPEESSSPTSGPDVGPSDSTPASDGLCSTVLPQGEVSSSSETTPPTTEITSDSSSVNMLLSEAQSTDGNDLQSTRSEQDSVSPSDMEMASSSEEQLGNSEAILPMEDSKEASSAESEVSAGPDPCDQSEVDKQSSELRDSSQPCDQSETVDQSQNVEQAGDPQPTEATSCHAADTQESSGDSNVDSTDTSKKEPEVSSISQSEEHQTKDSDSDDTSQQPMETD